jgi:Secretion system C-terminal sorting domain
MTSGSDVTFNIYQENIDDILISYDYPDMGDGFLQEKTTGLQFKNTFTFKVPQEFFGKFSVTAYGYSNGQLVVQHTVEPIAQLPANVTLQSIKFNQPEVTLPEQNSITFNLLGAYSDGVERRINDLPGITFTIENSTILQQADSSTLKSITPGQSNFKATVGTLEATLGVTVEENILLLNNIVANFFSQNQSAGPITLKWDTYQEYKSKKFILERSTDNINFIQINEQLGMGTIYKPQNYSYTDDTSENRIFYKLRLLNSSDLEVFSQVIEVNRSTLSNENLDLAINKNELSLAPNPLKTNIGQLIMNSSFLDNDAKLSIYDLTGKLIFDKSCSVKEGSQKIQFEMPYGSSNGIYLIQLKTKGYIKTIKLVLQKGSSH